MTTPFSCRAREVTCHYGHVNRFCYLLTYLLTYDFNMLNWKYIVPTQEVLYLTFYAENVHG